MNDYFKGFLINTVFSGLFIGIIAFLSLCFSFMICDYCERHASTILEQIQLLTYYDGVAILCCIGFAISILTILFLQTIYRLSKIEYQINTITNILNNKEKNNK